MFLNTNWQPIINWISNKANWGSVPEWLSAIVSAIAIYFVYWQVNRQIKNEEILKTEFSRPIFSFNLISGYHDNLKTYIPNNGDIQDLRDITKANKGAFEGNILRYDADYSAATSFRYLSRIFYISNPSTQPMLFVRIEIHFKSGKNEYDKNETFWIGRINANESVQVLPHRFIKKLKDRTWVDGYDRNPDIKDIKLFFTTASNEKFMYLYSYEDNDLRCKKYRKAIKYDFYNLYLFDQDPYIIFKAY